MCNCKNPAMECNLSEDCDMVMAMTEQAKVNALEKKLRREAKVLLLESRKVLRCHARDTSRGLCQRITDWLRRATYAQ